MLNRANTKVGHEAAARSRARSSTKVRFEMPSDRGRAARRQPRRPGRARRAAAADFAQAIARRWRRRSCRTAEAQQPPSGAGCLAAREGRRRWASTTASRATRRQRRRRPARRGRRRSRGAGRAPRAPSAGRRRPVRRAEDARPPRRASRSSARELFNDETTEDLARARAARRHRAARRSTGTPLTREERRQLVREITDDILGYGPLEPFLARRHRDRGHGQRLRPGLRRARRARSSATRRDVRRRRAPAADHRQDRLAGRPPHRRGLADGRRAPARRQPRQRDHPAARAAAARR